MKTKKVKLKTIFGDFRQPGWELSINIPYVLHGGTANPPVGSIVTSYDIENLKKDLKQNGLKVPFFCQRVNLDVENSMKGFKELSLHKYHRDIETLKKVWGNIVKNPLQKKAKDKIEKRSLRSKWMKIHTGYKYNLIDGNHRAYALNELYGGEHEVEVIITYTSPDLRYATEVPFLRNTGV